MGKLLFSVFIAALLKFLAHPNFIINGGLGLAARIYYIPFLLFIPRSTLRQALLAGFVYGFLSYALFCSWLISYSHWAGLAVYLLFGLYWTVIFAFLYLCSKAGNYSFILNVLVLLCAEFLFTKGYLGFGYGVTGYTQWNIPFVLRAARYTKVWGISFIIILFNCLAADIIGHWRKSRKLTLSEIGGIIFLAAMMLNFTLAGASGSLERGSESLAAVLVQNNSDPWKGGIEEYEREIESLEALTDQALREHPDTELVVWPETSVVVDVISNFISKTDNRRADLARGLFDYINSKSCSFLVGTNFKSHNSAVLFTPAEKSSRADKTVMPDYQVYSKIHLVPFSEDFPLKPLLMPLYRKMVASGNVFWTSGDKVRLLNCHGVMIGTPICFEDTFGEIPAEMRIKGADLIVNLSNDSWSSSAACQYQHLAMAAFRSVENGIPSLRATNSGQTCYIDSMGRVVDMLEPFCEDWLYCEVKLNRLR